MRDLSELEYKKQLRSTLHAVMSINRIMTLIENNISNKDNKIKMIGDAYLESLTIIHRWT